MRARWHDDRRWQARSKAAPSPSFRSTPTTTMVECTFEESMTALGADLRRVKDEMSARTAEGGRETMPPRGELVSLSTLLSKNAAKMGMLFDADGVYSTDASGKAVRTVDAQTVRDIAEESRTLALSLCVLVPSSKVAGKLVVKTLSASVVGVIDALARLCAAYGEGATREGIPALVGVVWERSGQVSNASLSAPTILAAHLGTVEKMAQEAREELDEQLEGDGDVDAGDGDENDMLGLGAPLSAEDKRLAGPCKSVIDAAIATLGKLIAECASDSLSPAACDAALELADTLVTSLDDLVALVDPPIDADELTEAVDGATDTTQALLALLSS